MKLSTPEELQKQRENLEKQVQMLKLRKLSTQEEIDSIPERGLPANVICMADVMKPAVEVFRHKEEEANRLSKELRSYAKGKEKYCEIHKCEIPIDWYLSFSKSWFSCDNKHLKEKILIWGNCPKCMKEEQDSFVNEKWKKLGVPENMVQCTLGNFVTTGHEGKIKALEKVKAQIKKGGFLILRGNYGNGKTHLAVGALKECGGLMITEGDLLGELRKTYTSKSSSEEVINKYRECECLVIDELDSAVRGTDIPQLLYRILARRYDDKKFTILTSNETLDTILEILGGKLTDRIKDNYTVVTFDWKSHRGSSKEHSKEGSK